MTEAKWYTRPTNLLLAVVLLLSLGAALFMATPARAQSPSWPWLGSWIPIDTDPNEAGTGNDYRDVVRSYYNYDSTYLYLRLETYAPPQFPHVGARFKWLIDVGLDGNLYWSGQNILGSDYLLFIEDSYNDGSLEVYLLNALGDDDYSQYEPGKYKIWPWGPAGAAVAGYDLPSTGNFVDLYVSFNALGTDATHLSLVWATDQENSNLEQGPIVDSLDFTDTPIHLDADVEVIKDVDDHNPIAGGTIKYTITVINSGPADATNIVLRDQLPGGVTYVVDSPSQGTYDSGSGEWSVGDLADGASATLTITATVDDPFQLLITNTATITAVDQPDPDTGDNSDSTDIYPDAPPNDADLFVTKDVDNHLPEVGDTITYTVIVANTGPRDATNIKLTDQLPGEVTYQSHTASQGSYDDGTGIWLIGTIADGASATLTITGTLNCACGTTVYNTATITALDQTDPHLDDNSDTAEFNTRALVAARGVPTFPSVYIAITAALAAGILAYFVRRRVVAG